MNTKSLRVAVNKGLARLEMARRAVRREAEVLGDVQNEIAAVIEAQALVQEVARQVQRKVHARMAGVVCRCLGAVFDDPYTFRLVFEKRRGRTEVVLQFRRRGMELDPLTSSGGGVIDVAAFALRIGCMALKPDTRKMLFLDEPFKFVSVEYRTFLRRLLEVLAEEMDMQVIVITHIRELRVGEVVCFSRDEEKGTE